MFSIWALGAALLAYFLGPKDVHEDSDDDFAERISTLATALAASPAKAEKALKAEHRLESAHYDVYEGSYVLECDCGHRCCAISLALTGELMDIHHEAYVRYMLTLRKIHEKGSSIVDIEDLGQEMDRDWRAMSVGQRKEARLISVEIGWRLDAERALDETPAPFPPSDKIVSVAPPEEEPDSEPFGDKTAV